MAFAWAKSEPPPPEAETSGWAFKSPSLALLADRFAAPGKHEVLDLGAPRGENLAFFQDFNCRLHIEDIYADLAMFPPDDPLADPAELAARRTALLDRVLACDPAVEIDVIIGWDLFSYLHADAIRGLMERIGTRCRPGTLLFLLMSTGAHIPAVPARVVIDSNRHISYEPCSDASIAGPAYPPLALERMMPRFHLLHSFLLGERMQDYLFTFR